MFYLLFAYCCLSWGGWTSYLLLQKDGGYFGAWIMLPLAPIWIPFFIYTTIFKK